MMHAAVALSTHPDSARAALEAAVQVTRQLEGNQADWCIAFVTQEHADHLSTVLEALSGAIGTPYVVGCSAAGVLADGREVEEGPALGVLAVSSGAIRATPFLFHDEGDHGMTAGIRLGQRLLNSRGSDDLLLVWPDPFHVRPDRLLQSLDAVLGQVPVVGGAASANGAEGATFQFCGNECAPASVSGIRLGGKFRYAVGITQGCRPLTEPLRVTRAHDNLILEIDGLPALDVLREHAPAGLLDDPECALHYLSVGLLPDPELSEMRTGEYLVRNILTVDPDAGVLAIGDRVEEGQHIVFALREAPSAREDLQRMVDRLVKQQPDREYRFGLYFNCRARGRSLYQQEGIDSAILRDALPGVPLLGFFCNAEIGPIRGLNHLFTYTGVLVLFSD